MKPFVTLLSLFTFLAMALGYTAFIWEPADVKITANEFKSEFNFQNKDLQKSLREVMKIETAAPKERILAHNVTMNGGSAGSAGGPLAPAPGRRITELQSLLSTTPFGLKLLAALGIVDPNVPSGSVPPLDDLRLEMKDHPQLAMETFRDILPQLSSPELLGDRSRVLAWMVEVEGGEDVKDSKFDLCSQLIAQAPPATVPGTPNAGSPFVLEAEKILIANSASPDKAMQSAITGIQAQSDASLKQQMAQQFLAHYPTLADEFRDKLGDPNVSIPASAPPQADPLQAPPPGAPPAPVPTGSLLPGSGQVNSF